MGKRGEDLPLLPGEKADIRQEAVEVAGEQWLYAPNAFLEGQSPEDAINAGRPAVVRNFLRTIKYVGFS